MGYTIEETIEKLQKLVNSGVCKPTDTIMLAMYEDDEYHFSDFETMSWDGGCDTNIFFCNQEYIERGIDSEIDFSKPDQLSSLKSL